MIIIRLKSRFLILAYPYTCLHYTYCFLITSSV